MTDYDPKASRDALRAAAEQFLAAVSAVDMTAIEAMVTEQDVAMRGWSLARLWDALSDCRSMALRLRSRLDTMEGKR